MGSITVLKSTSVGTGRWRSHSAPNRRCLALISAQDAEASATSPPAPPSAIIDEPVGIPALGKPNTDATPMSSSNCSCAADGSLPGCAAAAARIALPLVADSKPAANRAKVVESSLWHASNTPRASAAKSAPTHR